MLVWIGRRSSELTVPLARLPLPTKKPAVLETSTAPPVLMFKMPVELAASPT